MKDKIFIDTNILVYASIEDAENIKKRNKAKEFMSKLDSIIVLSTQVINEFYVSLLKNKIPDNEIQMKIKELLVKSI